MVKPLTIGKKPDLKFTSSVFDFARKEEVPERAGRQGIFRRMSFYSELLRLFEAIQEEGVAPFESPLSIDLSKLPKEDMALVKTRKHLGLSFYIHLKHLLKRYKIEGKVELRRSGDRLFLVGVEE